MNIEHKLRSIRNRIELSVRRVACDLRDYEQATGTPPEMLTEFVLMQVRKNEFSRASEIWANDPDERKRQIEATVERLRQMLLAVLEENG